jgi:TonB family protein
MTNSLGFGSAVMAAFVSLSLAQSPKPSQADPFVDGVIPAADLDVRPKVVEKRVPAASDQSAEAPGRVFQIEFIIEADGKVRYARDRAGTLTSDPARDRTISLLRRWVFTPGTKSGAPARTLARLTTSFETKRTGSRGLSSGQPRLYETWTVEGADDDFGAGAAKFGEAGVVWPRPTKQTPPLYPDELRRDRRSGSVELEVIILPTGRVGAARVLSSTDERFETNALKCVRQWEFEPGLKAGQPTLVLATIVMDFRIG